MICCLDNFNGTYNNFIENFNNENPEFDINFYQNYYEDLILFKNKLKLMHHYYFIGSNENRYISENDFNNKNPNFIKMHKDKMKEHNKKLWLNELSKNKIIYSNRNNNIKVISLYDGKITTWSNKIKHENKTGYIHIWTEL